MKIYDRDEKKYLNAKVVAQHNLTEDAKLLMVNIFHDDYGISLEFAVIQYSDGAYFTTDDWTYQQPTSPKEITDYQWVDHWGQVAEMVDGLPVISSHILKNVLTAAEAEREWNLRPPTVRSSCLHKRFRPNEARRSGRDWLVTVAGMERLYGPRPPQPATE